MNIPASERPFLCFNRTSLEEILPHRGAALSKIDGVFYEPDQMATLRGVKKVREDDHDLHGHFPGAPTYPGYAQDEFVCLVAAALIPMSGEELVSEPRVVQKSVRYKKSVAPGDTLFAEVRLHGKRSKFFLFSAEIRNTRNEIVAEYDKIVGTIPQQAPPP